MSVDDTDTVRARLRAALDARALPRAATEAAQALLDRLDAPARVTLLGFPGSGRARLLNRLVGDEVLPLGRQLPTLCLRHGTAAHTFGMLPTGEEATWPGLSMDTIDQTGAVFLDLARPLPVLREFTLLELAADESPDDQLAAMAWAEERTDIALWFSRAYGPAEAGIWARAPERLRDNAYLVMTQEAAARSVPGFQKVLSITDDAASVAALLAELRACADRGRQGLLDHALLLLSRFEDRRPTQPRPEPSASVINMTEAAERVRTAIRPVPAPAPAPAPMAAPAAARTRPRTEPLQIPALAVDYLRTRAAELDKLIESLAELPEKRVLGFCLETVEELVEKVSAPEEPDPTTADIEEMVLEAADVIMLLQSEDGIEPATDAITLLLQLRRDLEARLAA